MLLSCIIFNGQSQDIAEKSPVEESYPEVTIPGTQLRTNDLTPTVVPAVETSTRNM
jgi:hypothetical protein